MIKNTLIRNNDAKQIKKVRAILRKYGYLKPKQKPLTECQRIKLEGKY